MQKGTVNPMFKDPETFSYLSRQQIFMNYDTIAMRFMVLMF
jgi:hypothetical protein